MATNPYGQSELARTAAGLNVDELIRAVVEQITAIHTSAQKPVSSELRLRLSYLALAGSLEDFRALMSAMGELHQELLVQTPPPDAVLASLQMLTSPPAPSTPSMPYPTSVQLPPVPPQSFDGYGRHGGDWSETGVTATFSSTSNAPYDAYGRDAYSQPPAASQSSTSQWDDEREEPRPGRDRRDDRGNGGNGRRNERNRSDRRYREDEDRSSRGGQGGGSQRGSGSNDRRGSDQPSRPAQPQSSGNNRLGDSAQPGTRPGDAVVVDSTEEESRVQPERRSSGRPLL